jgi:catechol-2,3-dioxygenase
MARIAEVALFTNDVARLTAFYENLLGRPPDSSSESHASFDLGGTTLFIHVSAPDGPEGAPNADHVAIALDQDAAAARARGRYRRGRAEGLLLGTLGVSTRP